MKLLIIDDDTSYTSSMSDILGEFGHTVEVANTGEEALRKVKDARYNAILLDLVMPGMNGLEVFRAIKKIFPSCVVIIVTGFTQSELIPATLDEGAYKVIQKPVKIKDMMGTLKEIQAHKT